MRRRKEGRGQGEGERRGEVGAFSYYYCNRLGILGTPNPQTVTFDLSASIVPCVWSGLGLYG